VFRELLARKLKGIAELSEKQLDLLDSHYQLLVRWNQKLNLTAIEGLESVVERHYCESIFLAVHIPAGPFRVADVGSGAGFPGIPVAVLRPDCEVALIESHQRKAVFLQEATRGLRNVQVLAMRAEEAKGPFERIVSRAVSYEDLIRVLKYIAPAADLLTGGGEPPDELGFRWIDVRPLPWGRSRFLRSGVRIDGFKTDVPRETVDSGVSRETV
jgi:16S rRNA (guanine527-N7)-methyltransferase